MATWTHRAVIASTTNATSYASSSFTPTVGDLLVVAFSPGSLAGTSPTVTASANSITFVEYTGAAGSRASVDDTRLFIAQQLVPSSPAAMTVTVNPGGTAAGLIGFVASVAGLTRTGTNAVRQAVGTANATAATPTGTVAGAILTGNPTATFMWNATSPSGVTIPTNYTSGVADQGYATPTRGGRYAFRNSGQTSATVAWGSTSATASANILVELDTSSADVNVAAPSAGADGAIAAPTVSIFLAPPITVPAAGATGGLTAPAVSVLPIDRVGTGSVTTQITGTSMTGTYPTVPGGILAGDLIVVWASTSGSTAPGTPSGFSSIVSPSGASFPFWAFFYKVAAGGETGTFSMSVPAGAANKNAVDVYRGVDTTTPLDATATWTSTGTTFTVTTTSVTTTVPGARLAILTTTNTAQTFTPATSPAAFTEIRDDSTNLAFHTQELPSLTSPGSTGTITFAKSSQFGNVAGILVALRPASTGAANVSASSAGATAAVVAPAVTGGVNIAAPSAGGTAAAVAPAVTGATNLAAPAAAAAGAMVAPALTAAVNVAAPAASAAGTIEAPVLLQAANVAAPSAGAAAAMTAPGLTVAANVAAPSAGATGAATVPTIFVGTSANVTAPAAAATGSATAPELAVDVNIAAPSAGAAASTTAPTLTAGVNIAAESASANGTVETPGIEVPVVVLAAAGVATASTTAPLLSVMATIEATAALGHGSMGVVHVFGGIRDITIEATLEPRAWSASAERTWSAEAERTWKARL